MALRGTAWSGEGSPCRVTASGGFSTLDRVSPGKHRRDTRLRADPEPALNRAPDPAPSGSTAATVADVDPVLRAEGLTKDYGSVLALDSLTLEIGGGTTGLVGANGAGKSTLLKILLGLIPPTGGRAEVLGHDIATEGEAIRAAVGYLPEHDCLPPDVSASDFVVHLAMMSGLPRVAARERAAEVLRHVGLAEERYRPMGGYSPA